MIRTGIKGDLTAILCIERGCATAPHWPGQKYEEILSGTGPVNRCLIVAEQRGRVVGFAVGSVVAGEGELENIAVEQEARRRGFGRLLIEAVLRWSGGVVVRLEVRSKSKDVVRLYERCGFQIVGTRPRYYKDPEDAALVMVKVDDQLSSGKADEREAGADV